MMVTSQLVCSLLVFCAGDGSIWQRFTDAINGELDLATYHHFESVPQEERNTRYQGNLKLEFSGSLSENWSYFLTPRLYADNMGWARGVVDEVPETQPERYIFDFEEAYVTYYGDAYDVRVGRQIFGWGVSDAYNPMDNINPLDVWDIPTAFKMGVFAASYNYDHEHFRMTLVGVPWFTPSRLIDENSRWTGDLSEAQQQFAGLDLVIGERQLPTNTLDNSGVGFRIATSSLITGWDLAFSYYDGVESIGVLEGTLAFPQVELSQVFPRYREFGASFSTVAGRWEFHGEAGAHYTDGDAMDDDYLEWVAGLNLTIDAYNTGFMEEVFVIFEYADEYLIESKIADNQFSGTGEYVRPFKGTWITSLDFKFSQDTHVKLAGALNQGAHDGFGTVEWTHKFSDRFMVELGTSFLNGPNNTFFGRWRDNDRAYLHLIFYL